MIFSLLLALTACGPDPFDVAIADGSVEALTTFIQENPEHKLLYMAESALEKQYGERARAANSIEGWDEYLRRYPEGTEAEDGLRIREQLMYDRAAEANTVESWQEFVDAYKYSNTPLKERAEQRLNVAPYLDQLTFGEVSVEPANLAENPEGEMNGFLVTADFQNTTGKTIESLTVQIDFMSDNDGAIQTDRWPLVADRNPDRTGRTEEEKRPIRNNGRRTFSYLVEPPGVRYNEGELDERWNNSATVTPVYVRFQE